MTRKNIFYGLSELPQKILIEIAQESTICI